MGTYVHDLLRRDLTARLAGAALPHVRDRHVWGATSKEVEFSNFFIEVPKVLKKLKYSIGMCLFTIAGMIVMATASFITWSWNITQFVAIFPLAVLCGSHLLLPIALNPDLMTFSWQCLGSHCDYI
jgi:hypothetical protein